MSPHTGQLGKLCPLRLHVTHWPGTRRRDVCSRYDSDGLSVGEWPRGVAGPSEDDAVSSDPNDGTRLSGRRVGVGARGAAAVGDSMDGGEDGLRGARAGQSGSGSQASGAWMAGPCGSSPTTVGRIEFRRAWSADSEEQMYEAPCGRVYTDVLAAVLGRAAGVWADTMLCEVAREGRVGRVMGIGDSVRSTAAIG
jgi:hypothetical protein